MACGSEGVTDTLTLACITSGFTPSSSVTFAWQDNNDKSISDFIQYPDVQSNGANTKISQLRVKAADWDPQKPYKCAVSHPSMSTAKVESFRKPAPPSPPTVNLLPVSSGNSAPDALICVIRDFYPKTLAVNWKVNGRDQTGSITWQTEKQAPGVYSASSILKVDRTKWDSSEEYTCEVVHQKKTFSQKTSK
ncbi:hypothetical protein JZ751_028806, partial [Albula glossodonta]